MIHNIIDAAINRRRTTLILMLVVIVFGVIARLSIQIESNPKIDVPVFVIVLPHEGISPEDAIRLLAIPLETEINAVEGINEISSFGSEGSARVIVEFDVEYDLDDAMVDIREALDRAKPKFPQNAEEPLILEQSTDDFDIITVNLVGEGVSDRVLFSYARELRDELEALSSVLTATIRGDREELLEVILDPNKLEAYQLPADQIMSSFLRNSRLIAAGSLNSSEGEFAVKIPSVVDNAADLFDFPLKVAEDSVITFADVGTVRRTFKDRTSYARVNGFRSVGIGIAKRSDANLIDTVEDVRAVTDAFRENIPQTIHIEYSQDQAPYAERQVVELQGNIVTALVLIMVLVVGAMGIRSGILVGMAIPVSFLFALILLWLMDYTYNFMVMFGMLLGLGMLIDGAIVITEYADRKLVDGHSRREAFSMSVKRMFWPVTASVATTLLAFAPLLFWPGVSGKFMSYLPVTVFAVLTGSLLYALIFGPTLGGAIGKPSNRALETRETFRIMESGDLSELKRFTGMYVRILRFTTRHAFLTVTLALLVLAGSFIAYSQTNLGMIFFNQADSTYAITTVRARGNFNIDESFKLVSEVEKVILGIPGIKEINTFTGGGGAFFGESSAEDSIGSIALALHETIERDLSADEIFEEIRIRTQHLAGLIIETSPMNVGPPIGKPIQIQISSAEPDLTIEPMLRIREYMDTQMDGLRDVSDTRPIPGIQWELEVDRPQAALFGADVALIGAAIQLVTNGIWLGEYRPNDADDAIDIRVRFPEDQRGLQILDSMKITTQTGSVPISNFVKRKPNDSVTVIQRRDRKMVQFVRANVAPGVLADTKVKELQAWLQTQDFHPAVAIDFRGANEEQEESVAFIIKAFGFALCMMFVLLVTQFNSMYQSLVILIAVVMSTAGVLLGLVITNEPFSAILTGVGIVSLAGIVVNNNIVLIDTYNKLKQERPNDSYVDVIVRTGAQRFRPVMLTTVTTVFGLLPLASNLSVDFINNSIIVGGDLSSFWVPLAQAIVWGLTFASLLTLVTTPALLALPYQIKSVSKRVLNLIPRMREARTG